MKFAGIHKKQVFIAIFIVLILFPAMAGYDFFFSMRAGAGDLALEPLLNSYRLRIWLAWICMVLIAIIYKWSLKDNFFFYWTYVFLLVAFAVFGYILQLFVNNFQIPTGFNDSYTFGVFSALLNFGGAAVLTGFLQAGVWWFTRKWHRK